MNGIPRKIHHVLVWRPEQDSNLRPTAQEANPNQARQRPPSPYMALTCGDNRLTPPDAARLLLTLALSLAPESARGKVGSTRTVIKCDGNYLGVGSDPLPGTAVLSAQFRRYAGLADVIFVVKADQGQVCLAEVVPDAQQLFTGDGSGRISTAVAEIQGSRMPALPPKREYASSATATCSSSNATIWMAFSCMKRASTVLPLGPSRAVRTIPVSSWVGAPIRVPVEAASSWTMRSWPGSLPITASTADESTIMRRLHQSPGFARVQPWTKACRVDPAGTAARSLPPETG